MPTNIEENIQARLCGVVEHEWTVGRSNFSHDYSNFEAAIDLFENERVEREYDWMSDIPLPEFAAQMLTQSSLDVAQYFQTRDFVETYVQDASDEALLAADAAEECINRTLNQRHIHYYQKFVRAKTMNNIGGSAIAKCWWNKQLGRFNFEVIDPRNVTMDKKYCYSLQDKDWIIIRGNKTVEDLKNMGKRYGYFNLDKLEEAHATGQTEAKTETTDRDEEIAPQVTNTPTPKDWDIYERYGKFWYLNGEPGIDQWNKPLPNARYEECVMTVAKNKSTKVLIGFHLQPYKCCRGERYRPLIRGLCYIHPTRDSGIGDGHYSRPLAIAINDTFNMSNDRVRLATMPTLKGNKHTTEDTDSIYFEPGHMMELNTTDDVEEIKIEDNINGALTQLGILTQKMQQLTAIQPPQMGGSAEGGQTATEVANVERNANTRTNYKSVTWEYTFLNELYWIIQQMTWQFATEEVGYKLMGDKAYEFNPNFDFFYKPLSQTIETEFSRNNKIRHLTNMMQMVASSPHPDMPIIFNYILSKIMILMGDEWENIADKFLGEDVPLIPQETGTAPAGQPTGAGPSNQIGIPQSGQEIEARQGALVA
jgi:hypothetical protein